LSFIFWKEIAGLFFYWKEIMGNYGKFSLFFWGKKLWEIMGNYFSAWGKLFFGMGEIISRDGEGRESLKYGAAKISHNFP
jgi:hypothetical protein